MATSISKEKTQNECWPSMVELLRIFGADYRRQHDRYNSKPQCPPSRKNGSESVKEVKWTQKWWAAEEALRSHPLLWLCEHIVDLTSVDSEIDFNIIKESAFRFSSGWHVFNVEAHKGKSSHISPRIVRELRALDCDGSNIQIVKRLVNRYPNHGAVAELLKKYPQLNQSEPSQTTINLGVTQNQHILVVQDQAVQKKKVRSRRKRGKRPQRTTLSDQEKKVQYSLDAGLTQVQIARQLRLTEGRISQIVKNIKQIEKSTSSRSIPMGKMLPLHNDFSPDAPSSTHTRRQRRKKTD